VKPDELEEREPARDTGEEIELVTLAPPAV
jgi:hypothetical protein